MSLQDQSQTNDASFPDRHEMSEPLLDVDNLQVSFGPVTIPDGVSFRLNPGEILGIVGESGSGKSMTALSLMRLLPEIAQVNARRLNLLGEDLLQASESRMTALRGSTIGMIFQEPMTALNPVMTIGEQVAETAWRHLGIGKRASWSQALDALRRVGIPSPAKRAREYPHQLSGGMRQRVMIAMALICQPRLLIADEPTTALDVTIQAQILDLMLDLQREYRMAIILISHDLGVVSAFCDHVLIMYLGQVMEEGRADTIFSKPGHPYTEALLASIPRIDTKEDRLKAIRGTVPPVFDQPPGCRFAPRCDYSRPICETGRPRLVACSAGNFAACIRNTNYQFVRDIQ